MRQWQKDHGHEDDSRHQENIARFAEGSQKMELLASKKDLENLPTRADLADFSKLFVETDEKGQVKYGEDGKMIPRFATKKDLGDLGPVKAFYDKLALSAQIVDGTGKFISARVFWLAAFLLALGVITGKIWVILAWLAGTSK